MRFRSCKGYWLILFASYQIIPFCSILILDASSWGATVLHSDGARRLHPALAVCARAFCSRAHPSIRGVTEESHPTLAEMNPRVPCPVSFLRWCCVSVNSSVFFLLFSWQSILEFHSKGANHPRLKTRKVRSYSHTADPANNVEF